MAETTIQGFIREADFEEALTQHLLGHGWNEVIMNPTEEDLIRNWMSIIYDNNRQVNRLGDYPLTPSEASQIMEKVKMLGTPFAANRFIKACEVPIVRDNPADTVNCGKDVYLKIFDPMEISSGQSRYQIARQPRFSTSEQRGDRRGDLMLLINGMPVIHIELKRKGVDVSQACFQIKRYNHEGVFSNNLFSLVQIFVAMTPEETLYFANPGTEERFQPQYYFHWQDFNNQEVKDWRQVATDLLSIPMAHQMVGFYTIADDKDKSLKVLRSYQYFAASKISDVVSKTNWDTHKHRGGYVWHTTGSGKTMTSFKSAEIIAKSGDADKVIFLLDRIELAVQSLSEYRGFAGDADVVQETTSTAMLLKRLLSNSTDDALIVTSIQKMSNIREGEEIGADVIRRIGQKRLVFVIDECHRSVFGAMLMSIKETFKRALLFGFTGTPVFDVNAKSNDKAEITTETIFGDMLHKYTIGNGIPDGNVLGFDPYKVLTHDDDELRELVAFRQIDLELDRREKEGESTEPDDEPILESIPESANRRSVDEYMELIRTDRGLKRIYDHFVRELPMPKSSNVNGKAVRGVEAYLPKDIYRSASHHETVARDIAKSFATLSKGGKFHAMLATKSIPEAIAYYELFRQQHKQMKVVAVFDNNIDNSDEGIAREDAMEAMLADYNCAYGTQFTLATYDRYKKDVAKRLAHKNPYTTIEGDRRQQIDLLIVVTQMLTGYDSKWINTLYVDKEMKYVDIIQAFSRTNRLFGADKPFGTIKYYSYPHTMEQNINDALEVYVDRPLGIFVDKLENNLDHINHRFHTIGDIFRASGIENFERLPDAREERNMFAKLFSELTHHLEAAKLQGFMWEQRDYEFQHEDTYSQVHVELDEATYMILLMRYRELFEPKPGPKPVEPDWEYEIDTYIMDIKTGTIDAEYIDSKFRKFIRNLYTEGPTSALTSQALQELCKSFASLSQTDQRTALRILHDLQSGDLRPEPGKTIQDYIAEYQLTKLQKQIKTLCEATGLDALELSKIMSDNVTAENLDEFGRYVNLLSTMDAGLMKDFVARVMGKSFPVFQVRVYADNLLKQFILQPEKRDQIIAAWVNDDVTMENAEESVRQSEENEQAAAQATPQAAEETPEERAEREERQAKEGLRTAAEKVILPGVLKNMRGADEVTNALFYVLETETLKSLDGMKDILRHAMSLPFGPKPTFVDKQIGFRQMVTSFEPFLKKIYYMKNGEELKPVGKKYVELNDTLEAFDSLWGLRDHGDWQYRKLSWRLTDVRNWRNDESHNSYAISDEELDKRIQTTLALYYYATGSEITDMELNGHDMVRRKPKTTTYDLADDDTSGYTLPQAAQEGDKR